jgi:hypothetical protein
MPAPSLDELEAHRAELYAALAEVGDVRRGSVSVNYRRCGKPNCACTRPGHPGHGPRYLWTRTVGGKSRGRQLAGAEVGKVRRELDRYAEFVTLTDRLVEVNERICEARPAGGAGQDGPDTSPVSEGEKGGC